MSESSGFSPNEKVVETGTGGRVPVVASKSRGSKMYTCGEVVVGNRRGLEGLQGYLAHKKHPHFRAGSKIYTCGGTLFD